MNKNKKQGFTLVELLAVIVILSVVILIAVTAIIPRMNSARKKAFIDEALMYLKASNEAALSGDSVDCFDASNIGEYIQQSKQGYSGALFVNENNKMLYLTNGRYYLITDGNMLPTEESLSETKPSNFVESCSDTSNSYTITYDLDGGTLATDNPSSYTPNTNTITLNNPTKSGYEFVGWSTKNEFDKTKYLKMEDFPYAGTYKYNSIPLKPNTEYVVSVKRYNGYNGKDKNLLITYKNADDSLNLNTGWTAITHNSNPNRNVLYTTSNDGLLYIATYGMNQTILDRIWANTDVQIEKGTTATDYQEYMAPNKNAKIYRGSTGNKKFIANWQAI